MQNVRHRRQLSRACRVQRQYTTVQQSQLRLRTHESVCDGLLSPLPEAVKLDRGDPGLGTGIGKNLFRYVDVTWKGQVLWLS